MNHQTNKQTNIQNYFQIVRNVINICNLVSLSIKKKLLNYKLLLKSLFKLFLNPLKACVFSVPQLHNRRSDCTYASWFDHNFPPSLCKKKAGKHLVDCLSTAFIYFSQGSPISPLRTAINRSPVHPKNYKIQYNLKILKRKFTHYNIAKTSIKEVKISSWPRRKPN